MKAGQILAHLDDTQPRAALAFAEAQLASSREGRAEDQARLRAGGADARPAAAAAEGGGRRQGGARRGAVRSRVAQGADRLRAAADAGRREPGQPAADRPRRHGRARAVQRRRDLEGRAARRDDLAGVGRRRLHPHRASAPSSTCRRSRSKSTSTRATSTASRPGQKVEAVLDAYQDWRIPAHVITTIPTADRQKATVRVRIGFDELDPRILPDMGVKVSFLRDEPAAGTGRAAARRAARAQGGDPHRGRQVDRLRGEGGPRRAPRGQRRPRDRRPGGSALRVELPASRWSSDGARATLKDGDKVEGAVMADALVTVRDLHKVFQRGGQRIDVLQGVNLDIPEGRLSLADGSVGLRQDDAAEPDRRARHADRRLDRRWPATASTSCRAASCRRGARATSASSSSCTTCCRC